MSSFRERFGNLTVEQALELNEKINLTLHENVLTSDYITILGDKTVKLVYYTYASQWSDEEHTEYFNSLDDAIKWYEKNFKDRAIDQGKMWSKEDGIENISEEEAIDMFESCTLYCEF